jgi:hypothetical protein
MNFGLGNKPFHAAALGVAAWFVCGCSSTVETGYVPRPLGGSSTEVRRGSSTEVRRGYYAQPFTPEAKKAHDYEQDFGTPTPGGRAKPGY